MVTAAFIILGLAAIVSAIMVISFRNPMASAIALIVTLCSIAGLFAIMGATFVAALQVIVYAGAIMVLFLFVIMLLNLKRDEFGPDKSKIQKTLAIILGVLLVVEVGIFIQAGLGDFGPGPAGDKGSFTSITELSSLLFTKYLFPFEVTSLLLLVAIVGAVILAKKKL
ncbi:MAG: NADH-quinone oxidoreductase subunit J [Candidatus Zixiibacteriota bacterium]